MIPESHWQAAASVDSRLRRLWLELPTAPVPRQNPFVSMRESRGHISGLMAIVADQDGVVVLAKNKLTAAWGSGSAA